jgi:PRC-barrel domain protein
MPSVERIESWHGQDVLDDAGEKTGRLEEVYYDAGGQDPVLISIKHGMLGRQVQLVPVADAVLSRDYLRLPFTGEQIGQSPSVSVEDELNSDQVAAIAALFNVTLSSSGPLYGATLLERRRSEAETAQRRAKELEREADDRKEEAEEARRRAGAAAEEAHAAQRARERAEAAASDAGLPEPGSE